MEPLNYMPPFARMILTSSQIIAMNPASSIRAFAGNNGLATAFMHTWETVLVYRFWFLVFLCFELVV